MLSNKMSSYFTTPTFAQDVIHCYIITIGGGVNLNTVVFYAYYYAKTPLGWLSFSKNVILLTLNNILFYLISFIRKLMLKALKVMSEKEILSMPEDDYMNEEQLNFFKHKLLDLESEMVLNAQKTTQTLQDQDTNYIADPSDRATIEEEYALELRTRDRERKLLQKIRNTLEVIERGDYGYCEDTGEPIGLKRLIARPTATLSIEAQERREKMQKHFADE